MPEGGRHSLEVRIHPAPDAQARAALERALARVGPLEPTPGRSAWWRTGVRDNVADAAGQRAPNPGDR